MSNHQTETSIEKLQSLLNETTVKHSETVYWLQLELDTTRKSKEAVEDRMTELYRDLQELQESKASKPRSVAPDNQFVTQQQKQIEKYERMLRIMNNQIGLVRSSADGIVKSLKDEISDLMDEKTQSELSLMNKLSALEKEKCELDLKVASMSDKSSTKETTSSPPRPPQRHKSLEDEDDTTALLKEDLKRLRQENRSLKQQISADKDEDVGSLKAENARLQAERTAAEEKMKAHLLQWTKEKATLEARIDTLNLTDESKQWADDHREAGNAALERVALLWDRANGSIQVLEGIVAAVRSNSAAESERVLSVLETASLVQNQVKVSLMLLELKFRNSLACVENDRAELQATAENSAWNDEIQRVSSETMEGIQKVEGLVDGEIEELKTNAFEESEAIREMYEAKVADLRRLAARHVEMESEIKQLHNEKLAESKTEPGAVEMFVSQKALETLQKEVLQVVERVKEKNASIGRLTAEIEEHKVREKTLMDELRRHMKEQAHRQLEEQQRIMQENAQYEDSSDSSGGSGESSEYEEKTVEESYYEEKTVYDEETVL